MENTTIAALVARAHGTAKAKGFHDRPVHISTAIALIRTELAEAVEADRQPGVVDFTLTSSEFAALLYALKNAARYDAAESLSQAARPRDRGEELADAVIRIFDLAGREGLDLMPVIVEHAECFTDPVPDTIAGLQKVAPSVMAALLREEWEQIGFAGWLENVHESLCDAQLTGRGKAGLAEWLTWALLEILAAAEWLGIDLEKAVLAKMARNEARPRMHGGKAY